MLSNFNSKLNVKSTPNLISVDYLKLIYEFITELMVFAKYADFRTEKTTFIWLLWGLILFEGKQVVHEFIWSLSNWQNVSAQNQISSWKMAEALFRLGSCKLNIYSQSLIQDLL